MNIGEFLLSKENLKMIEESLQNMTESEKNKMACQMKITTFISEILNESVESKAVFNLRLPINELVEFIIEVIAQVAVTNCFRFGSRTNDLALFFNLFKRKFETLSSNFMEVMKND